MRKQIVRLIIVMVLLGLLAGCATKQYNSRSEAFVATWAARDKTKILVFHGIGYTHEGEYGYSYDTLISVVACPEVIEEIDSFFGESDLIDVNYGFPNAPSPLEQIDISEDDAEFPEGEPPGFAVIENEYLFGETTGKILTWDNPDDPDTVARRCDNDWGQNEEGPVNGSDLEADIWATVKFDEGSMVEVVEGEGGYQSLPLVAKVDLFINAAPFLLLGLIALTLGVRSFIRKRMKEKEFIHH